MRRTTEENEGAAAAAAPSGSAAPARFAVPENNLEIFKDEGLAKYIALYFTKLCRDNHLDVNKIKSIISSDNELNRQLRFCIQFNYSNRKDVGFDGDILLNFLRDGYKDLYEILYKDDEETLDPDKDEEGKKRDILNKKRDIVIMLIDDFGGTLSEDNINYLFRDSLNDKFLETIAEKIPSDHFYNFNVFDNSLYNLYITPKILESFLDKGFDVNDYSKFFDRHADPLMNRTILYQLLSSMDENELSTAKDRKDFNFLADILFKIMNHKNFSYSKKSDYNELQDDSGWVNNMDSIMEKVSEFDRVDTSDLLVIFGLCENGCPTEYFEFLTNKYIALQNDSVKTLADIEKNQCIECVKLYAENDIGDALNFDIKNGLINGYSVADETLLYKAAFYGRPNLVKYLLDEGSNPNTLINRGNYSVLFEVCKLASENFDKLSDEDLSLEERKLYHNRVLDFLKIADLLIGKGVSSDDTYLRNFKKSIGVEHKEETPLSLLHKISKKDFSLIEGLPHVNNALLFLERKITERQGGIIKDQDEEIEELKSKIQELEEAARRSRPRSPPPLLPLFGYPVPDLPVPSPSRSPSGEGKRAGEPLDNSEEEVKRPR